MRARQKGDPQGRILPPPPPPLASLEATQQAKHPPGLATLAWRRRIEEEPFFCNGLGQRFWAARCGMYYTCEYATHVAAPTLSGGRSSPIHPGRSQKRLFREWMPLPPLVQRTAAIDHMLLPRIRRRGGERRVLQNRTGKKGSPFFLFFSTPKKEPHAAAGSPRFSPELCASSGNTALSSSSHFTTIMPNEAVTLKFDSGCMKRERDLGSPQWGPLAEEFDLLSFCGRPCVGARRVEIRSISPFLRHSLPAPLAPI